MEQQENQQPAELNMLEKAEAVAKRIEEANKVQAELLARQEKIQAQQILGGTSNAGKVPEAPKEETPQEYAARVMRGEV